MIKNTLKRNNCYRDKLKLTSYCRFKFTALEKDVKTDTNLDLDHTWRWRRHQPPKLPPFEVT